MSQPFDAIAMEYDALWTHTPRGQRQRQAVWDEVDSIFPAGTCLLDLGCGTGVDAAHLRERGIAVHAIDASLEMVRAAQARGIAAQHLPIEHLGSLHGQFDGALSDFGAMNCVRDLDGTASELARLVRPNGTVVLCVMGRLCWSEVLSGLARGDWRKAFRRWSGRSLWRGIEVYYPTTERIRAAFSPAFELVRSRSLGWGDHWLSIWRRRL